MDAKERLFKALNHEEADRIPSYELFIDNYDVCHHFGEEYVFQGMTKTFNDVFNLCEKDVERTSQTIISTSGSRSYIRNTVKKQLNLYTKIGFDLAQVPMSGYIMFPIECGKDYFIDEYGRIFDLKFNPSDNMDLIYYREGYFKSFEDFEQFPPLEADTPRRERYFKMMKKAEQEYEGKIVAMPTIWGIFESVWQSFGFVQFSKMLRSGKQFKTLIDDRGKFAVELAKCFMDWAECPIINLFDDLGFKGGLLTNPKHVKEHVVPWYKKLCETAKKGGAKVLLHSCGDIETIFEDIVNAGFAGVHPIEPTTANPDFDIFKLNEKYGDKIAFIGNVSPQDLADKSPEYIKEASLKLIKELGPNGGYIFSSGHSINPAVKLENFLAMREILEKHGKY